MPACRGCPHTGASLGYPSLSPGTDFDCPLAEAPRGFPPLPLEGIDFPALERSFERYYISEAIRLSGGNETQAARLLNLNHHTLRYRKKKLEGDD